MKAPIQHRRALFIKIFTEEFLREFQFLSDVVAGRAARKGDFTDKLFSILNKAIAADVTGTASGALGATTLLLDAATVTLDRLGFLHARGRDARLKTIGHLRDRVDLEALRILVLQVAEETLRRHDFFITMRLSEDPKEGVIPLAKAGVERILEYIAQKDLELNYDNLLKGLIEGRSGAYVSGFQNTKLKGNDRYSTADFTAEGLYARSAFQTPDNRIFSRETPKHKEGMSRLSALSDSLYDYGYTNLKDNEPKYGYALVPLTLVQHYGFHPHEEGPVSAMERSAYFPPARYITKADIESYLKRIDETSDHIPPLATFLAETKYPSIVTPLCHEDLSDLELKNGNYQGVDFSHAILKGDISHANFSNAILRYTEFIDINAFYTNFTAANLEYASLTKANLQHAIFIHAHLDFANLTEANVLHAQLIDVSWYQTDLSGIISERNLIEEQKCFTDGLITLAERIIATTEDKLTTLGESVVMAAEDKLTTHAESTIAAAEAKLEATSEAMLAAFEAILQERMQASQLKLATPDLTSLERTRELSQSAIQKILNQYAIDLSQNLQNLNYYIQSDVVERIPDQINPSEYVAKIETHEIDRRLPAAFTRRNG